MAGVATLKAALAHVRAAEPAYRDAREMYEGTSPELFASEKLRRLLAGQGKRLRVNLIATCVDAVADLLEIAALTADTPTAQAVVDDVVEDNHLGLGAKDVHATASEYGDAYVIALPDDTQTSGVALYTHGPEAVRVFYDPSRPRVKTHAVHWWTQNGGDFTDDGYLPRGYDGYSTYSGPTAGAYDPAVEYIRANLYYPDRTEQWISTTPLPTDRRVDWEELDYAPFAEDEPNDTGVVPVFHFRAGPGQYGRPEHHRGYGMQHALNKALITLMSTVDTAGFPQRYALQDEAATAGAFGAPESLMGATDPDRDRTIQQAGPGIMQILTGVKSIGQFPAADLEKFLAVGTQLVQWMAAATTTPLHNFELAGGFPSGASRREANAPLLSKAGDRQARYGVEWRNLWAHVLHLRGLTGTVQVVWAPMHVEQDLDSWQTLQVKVANGVPADVALVEQGYLLSSIETWPVVVAARAARGLTSTPAASTPVVPAPRTAPDAHPTGVVPGVPAAGS